MCGCGCIQHQRSLVRKPMKAKRDPHVGGDRYNDTPAENVSVQLLCGEASILVDWSEHPTVR